MGKVNKYNLKKVKKKCQGHNFSFCTAYYKWNTYWHVLSFDFQNFHNDSVDTHVYKETMASGGTLYPTKIKRPEILYVPLQKPRDVRAIII
jgi:hypothetical protein